MKKLILAIGLLLTPISAFCDSITSGVGLLLPTTGALDPTRNWGDKYNENFRIIASTLTEVLTTGLNGKIDAGQNNAGVVFSSMIAPGQANGIQSVDLYNGVANITVSTFGFPGASFASGSGISSVTFMPAINSTYTVLTSTGIALNNLQIFRSTTDVAIGAFISTYNVLTTTGIALNNVQVAISSMSASILNLNASTATLGQVWGDEGGPLVGGVVTKVDCVGAGVTCAQSVSSVTITVTASAGGGGPSIRNFDGVVIGTSGAVGTDATVVTQANWHTILSSFAMGGLTQSTTGMYTKFFLRNGSYVNAITTIPANAIVMCESSAALVLNNIGRLVTVYGQLGTKEYPCSIDGGGYAFTQPVVTLATASKSDLILYGMRGQNGNAGSMAVSVKDSTGVVSNLWFKEFATVNGVTIPGDRNVMQVVASSMCIFNIRTSTFIPTATSANAGILYATNIWDCEFNLNIEAAYQAMILVQGGGRNKWLGKMDVPLGASGAPGTTYGLLTFRGEGSPVNITTQSYVNMNFNSHDTGGAIFILVDTNNQNFIISGSIMEERANTHTGIQFLSGATNNAVSNFYMWRVNTGVTDGGTTTTLNYWKDGKHVANN